MGTVVTAKTPKLPRIHMGDYQPYARWQDSPYLCGTNSIHARWYGSQAREPLRVTCKRCLVRMFWTA